MPKICQHAGFAAPRHRTYEEFASSRAPVQIWTPVEDDPELGGRCINHLNSTSKGGKP